MKRKAIRKAVIKNIDPDILVEGFLNRVQMLASKEIKRAFESCFAFVVSRYGTMPEKSLLSFLKERLGNLYIKFETDDIESIYEATAKGMIKEIKRLKKTDFVFDSVDFNTLSAIEKNFFWLMDNGSERVRNRIYEIVESAFKGEARREDLPDILEREFGSALKQETRYFKDVSDHIISQGQNLARVRQGEKYGVDYYKVLAVMDSRTTPICRSMNGRIIPSKHLENQADKIQDAKDIMAKKKAAPWRTKAFLGKTDSLDKNFGLPPYHFRCRTIVQPVWVEEEEIVYNKEKFKVKNTGQSRNQGEIFRHIDKTGVERFVDESVFNHSVSSKSRKDNIKNLAKALNSIKAMGTQENGRYIALSENNHIIIFDGDKVWTFFKPLDLKGRTTAENYFKTKVLKSTKEVIKWEKESYLSELIRVINGKFMMKNIRM